MLNRSWLKHLTKGTYSGIRTVLTMLNALTFFMMLGAMVSGILMSHYVFGFLRIKWGLMYIQSIHLFCSYWSFVLMSVHLGMHWTMVLKHICRKTTRQYVFVLRCMAGAAAGLGFAAFVRNRLTDYLFLQTHFVFFDFDTTVMSFLLDYFFIMCLFVCIGYYLGKAAKTRKDVLQ